MSMQAYNSKRLAGSTPEPKGKKAVKAHRSQKLVFTIQKHAASHLHYDLRLEVDGVLKSWAVPKGMPKEGEKHLAIMVEDHPFDYRHFEGTIPRGNYGAGSVMVWDTGSYEPINAAMEAGDEQTMRAGLAKGECSFLLHGTKLHGAYTLVKMKAKENQWLLIKRTPAKNAPIDDDNDKSALTGRSMHEIAEGKPAAKKKS